MPKSDYGTFDLINCKNIPDGVAYIDLPYIAKILKKNNIEYVETVIGFEKSKKIII